MKDPRERAGLGASAIAVIFLSIPSLSLYPQLVYLFVCALVCARAHANMFMYYFANVNMMHENNIDQQ